MKNQVAIWQTDWKVFVKDVADRFSSGYTEKMLSELFGGKAVTWTGTVFQTKLDDEYVPGVAVDLPEVKVPIRDDLTLIAGYMYLNIDRASIKEWSEMSKDDVIRFECILSKGSKIFPGVKISVFEEDKECVLKLTLEDAKLLSVVSDRK